MPLEQQPVVLVGGVNSLLDPLAVPDQELVYGKNLWPRKLGLASVRPAMRHLEYALPPPSTSSLNFNQVRDHFFTNNLAAGIILAVSGGNEQGIGTHYGNSFDYPDVGVRLILMDSIAGSDDAGNPTYFLQTLGDIADRPCVFDLNDFVIALDGLNTGFYWQRGTPFTMTAITWTGEPPAAFKPKFATLFQNRVVYAQDNYLVWADENEPFVVGVAWPLSESDPITALDRISANGISQAQTDLLLVRTLHNAYLISGFPDATTEANGSKPQLAKLPVAAGCVSQATAVTTPYGHIWCGVDDVWMMSGGSIPQRIGSKIRPQIQRLSEGFEWVAHACFADGVYRLALPSAGQEQGPDEPLQEQFWLDLRQGMPQDGAFRWYGPMVPIPSGVWDGADRQGTSTLKLDTRVGKSPLATSAVALRSLQSVSDIYDTWPTTIALAAFDGDEPVDCVYPRYAATPQARIHDTAYAIGDIVAWNDFLWECVVAGTTDATTTASVFTGPGTAGSWADTGTTTGKSITDGSVQWSAVMVVPDNVDGSSEPKRSPAPAFISNARANEALVLYELLTKEFVGADPQLDKRLDTADLSYSAGKDHAVAYQMLPNFAGYEYPGIERILDAPETTVRTDAEVLPISADVRRLAKDSLPSDPSKRNSAQHFQFRLQNLGGIITENSENNTASIFGGNFFRAQLHIWAEASGTFYHATLQSLADTAAMRRAPDVFWGQVSSDFSSALDALTVSSLTNGAIPSGDPVITYSLITSDPLNPNIGLQVTLPMGTPFDNVWVLFNNYGELNPDGGSSAIYLTRQNAPAADLMGGSTALSADILEMGSPLFSGGQTKLIQLDNSAWSCQPVVPEIATLNLFVKTFGRRSKTGVIRSLSTS